MGNIKNVINTKLIGLRNTASQSVLTNGIVNLGQTYRKFIFNGNCDPFTFNGTSLTLNRSGIYRVTVNATFSAPVAGDITLSLFANGTLIPGALATESITTATTEVRSISFETDVLVSNTRILNVLVNTPIELTLVNTSTITATITNVVMNVEKVV